MIDDNLDPFNNFFLSLAWVASRAGFSPEEIDDIAWLTLDAFAVSRESGPWQDRPALSRVQPRSTPAPEDAVAALRSQVDEVLSAVVALSREPDPAVAERTNPANLGDGELIEMYLTACRRRNLSKRTVERLGTNLQGFSRDNRKRFATTTRADVERVIDSRVVGAKTRYCLLSALHNFYAWAIDEGHLSEDPTAKIRRPKLDKQFPRPMADTDISRALASADRSVRCWLLLGAYQGLRCQEMAGLNREDVLDDQGLLRVCKGKGAKERIVPLHPETLLALRALPMPERGPLFRRKRTLDRYPAWALSQELNGHLRSLGIESTAHSLRHAFATKVYRSTKDLRLTQELLGHSSPTTTAGYAAFDPSKTAPAVYGLTIESD